jgi:ABC-type polar amino acid transport system ATPase subunit
MTEIPMINPILETRNLTKIYGQNIIFKDINLKVNKGETIVIIGPSGTGKSTLLRCINLLTSHNGGQVFLDGNEITASKLAWSSKTSCFSIT